MGNGSVNGSRVTTAGTTNSISTRHGHGLLQGGEDRHSFHNSTSSHIPVDQGAVLWKAFEDVIQFFEVSLDKEQLINSCQLKEIDKEETVIEAGELVQGVYIVIEGRLGQKIVQERGKTILLNVLSSGDMIGEVESLIDSPQSVMSIKITTLTRCKVLFVPKESVKESLSNSIEEKQLREWCIQKAYFTNEIFNKESLALSIVITAIKCCDLFSSWGKQAVEYMSRLCLITLFQANSIVYKMDEPSNHVFILIKGKIQLIGKSRSKQLIEVKHTNKSYMFGAKDFLQKSSPPRQDTANIIDTSMIVMISKEIILTTIDKFTEERILFAAKGREYRT